MSLISRIGSLVRKRSEEEAPEDPFLSMVTLLSAPQTLSEDYLATLVERAYGPDSHEDATGRILQAIKPGHAYFLKLGPHLFNVINSFNPYSDNPAERAAIIPELRRRRAFAEHHAWRSVDYLSGPYKAEAAKAYEVLGKLSAEFLSAGYLGLYFPSTNEVVPASPTLAEKLRAFSSLEDLHATSDIIVPVEEDDPRLAEVVYEARARWPEFLEAFSRRNAEDAFLVKSCFADENGQEWMWSTVDRIEESQLIGRLANSPNEVKHVSEGDEVEVHAREIGDWFYTNDSEQVGQFSSRLLEP
jgi:uncharacterized protein YegJ (DUF2314 family)